MAERMTRLRSVVEKPLQKWGMLSIKRFRLPDFLCIGSQKSGTTWLHEQLRHHPDIMLPDEKEQHYFDWNFHQPLANYAKVFEGAGERMCGEITPGYAIINERRIDYLASIMPKVKIIFLMRDPVERAWSQVVMNTIEIQGHDPSNLKDADWISLLNEPRVRKRGDYLSILQRWGRRIPEEQFQLAFFEDVHRDPEKLLGKVHRFLKIAPQEVKAINPRNVIRRGVQVEMPDAVRESLVASLKPELEALARQFGAPCTDWFERWTS